MKIAIIGAHLGVGAQICETSLGPAALKSGGLEKSLQAQGVDSHWVADVYEEPHNSAANKECIQKFNGQLAQHLVESCQGDRLPVVLGGDHAIAMGTWLGVSQAYNAQRQLGLIWVDAHMDAHVPESSPSQALHGMPVAGLLGQGVEAWGPLLDSGAIISPEHIVLLGLRSYEPAEEALFASLGVKYYDMSYIREHGFDAAFALARAQVSRGTQGYGISIDLDAFDPSVAPGVGSPEHGGLLPKEVLPALASLKGDPKLRAIEIAEYNPHLDSQDLTGGLVAHLITEIVA